MKQTHNRSKPTITVEIDHLEARRVPDPDPDLSWLDQTDDQMGEGFEAEAAERKAGYANGDWQMLGLVVVAVTVTGVELAQESLWSVESDSGNDYFTRVGLDLIAELEAQLGVSLTGVPIERIDQT